MSDLPVTDYFRDNVLVKRPYLRLEWCEAAIRDPIRTEVQIDDKRIRHWIWVEALGCYLRVVTLSDGRTIHNAFPDRRFQP
ncbi:hypothetical protein ABC977_17895 [Thioalkalicoccus limnaeus]|uniref:Integron cassette protein VCH-CASS1 chain domain-containing protein n=1 Tax=Thioalkalicoccus limnaeus TaxID=120681 RepID=A0ABV4BIB8_9GAMM